MAFPTGPKKETVQLISKVVKAAGKPGLSMTGIATKLNMDNDGICYAVERAVADGALKKLGTGRSTTYAQA